MRIKSPQFVLYFILPDGEPVPISFNQASAGNDSIHWLPAEGSKDFEIKIEDLNVEELFTNYLTSSSIELTLNSLELQIDGEYKFCRRKRRRKSE